MTDRTQEDINQDLRIAALEQNVKEIKRQLDAAGRTLAGHEERIKKLDPLGIIVAHTQAIDDFFHEWPKNWERLRR